MRLLTRSLRRLALLGAGVMLLAPSVALAAHAELPAQPVVEPLVLRPCTPYGLDLSWAAVNDPDGIARYDIEVRDQGYGRWTAAVDASTSVSGRYAYFLDGNAAVRLREGQTYDVQVRAVSRSGASGAAGVQSIHVPSTGPGAVSGFSGTFDGTTVRLSWDAAPAACGYAVETPAESGSRVVATSPAEATSAVDQAPLHGVSRYRIVPLNRYGSRGPESSVSISEPLPAIPPQPTCAWRDATLTSARIDETSMASLCLINHERVRQGVQPVWVDSRLKAAAEGHARDEVARSFFSHTNPDGCDPSCRARAAGYPNGAGENLAYWYLSPAEAVAAWLKSPGHRGNILEPGYRTVGSATAVGGASVRHWVHTFGLTGAPMTAVSGLEPEFQGPADPLASQRVEQPLPPANMPAFPAPVTPPTTDQRPSAPETAPGLSRQASQLKLQRVAIASDRRLRVRVAAARLADGERLRFVLRTEGRRFRFVAIVRAGRVVITRRVPRSLGSLRGARLTVSYAGNATLRPGVVQATLRRPR